MGTHVEKFRVSTSTSETADACHRALRSLEWNEQSSDQFAVDLLDHQDIYTAVVARWLRKHIPILRSVLDRYTIRSARAPEGPPRADAEISAVLGQRFIVRISLREHGGFGTDMTISGSDLAAVRWTSPLRSAVGELRRSIEVQSGSLTPYRPRTP